MFCDNCNSDKLSVSLVVDQYTIYNCSKCDLDKVYPNPGKDELQKLYSGVDRNIAKGATSGEIKSFNENSSQIIYALRQIRISPLQKFFPGLNAESSLCDVGCGSGIFLAAMQKLGYRNLYGIEYNPDSVELINQNFNFKKVVAGEIKRNDNIPAVDVITAFDVLEHVPNPSETMKEIHGMLNDETGYIHIRVPNYGSLWAKVFRKKWLWMIPPFHLNYFSHKSLRSLAENNGFEVIKLRSRRPGYRLAFWFLQLKKLMNQNIDSFSSSSYSKNKFFVINLVESVFRIFYFPIAAISQLFYADDCLELYAKKIPGKGK